MTWPSLKGVGSQLPLLRVVQRSIAILGFRPNCRQRFYVRENASGRSHRRKGSSPSSMPSPILGSVRHFLMDTCVPFVGRFAQLGPRLQSRRLSQSGVQSGCTRNFSEYPLSLVTCSRGDLGSLLASRRMREIYLYPRYGWTDCAREPNSSLPALCKHRPRSSVGFHRILPIGYSIALTRSAGLLFKDAPLTIVRCLSFS